MGACDISTIAVGFAKNPSQFENMDDREEFPFKPTSHLRYASDQSADARIQ
jgi:hypothetical protein